MKIIKLDILNVLKTKSLALTLSLMISLIIVNCIYATDPPSWSKTCETLTSSSVNHSDISILTNASNVNNSMVLFDCKIEEDFNVADTSNFALAEYGHYIIEVADVSASCIDRNKVILCNSSINAGPDQILCESSVTLTPTISNSPECFTFDCSQEERLIGFNTNDCNSNNGIQVSFQSAFVQNGSNFRVSNNQNNCNYVSDVGNSFDMLEIDGDGEFGLGEFEMTSERLISSISYYHYIDRGFILFEECLFCNTFTYDVEIAVNGVVEYADSVSMGIGNVELKQIQLTNPVLVASEDIVRIVIGKNRQSCVSSCDKLEISGINVFTCIDDFESGVSYSWSGPANFTSEEPSVTVDTPGTYCISFTDCNGCSTQDCVHVAPSDESCSLNTCGLSLGPDKSLCGEIILEAPEVNFECVGTMDPPSCACPPGYTEIGESYFNVEQGSYNLCATGTGNYTIDIPLASSVSVYACETTSVTLNAVMANCIDVFALNGTSAIINTANPDNVFYYLNEGSSIVSKYVNATRMNIFNSGGIFNLVGGGAVQTYAVSNSCSTTSLASMIVPGLTGIWRTSDVFVPSDALWATTTIDDPLNITFNNYLGCSNNEMRTYYSSRVEECGDFLDNDFDCYTDEDCGKDLVYSWSTGAKTKTLTVDTPGAYCLTVTCNELQCSDCIIVEDTVLEAKAGPDNFSCSPGTCFYIGELLVGPQGSSYSWSTGEVGIITNEDNGQIEVCPTVTTTYSVTITQGLICNEVDEVTITVEAPIAGTLYTNNLSFPICENSVTSIDANINVASQVPEGYEIRYLLVEGSESFITQESQIPEFEVATAGYYAIHSFVYDATTFDISSINFGSTTVSEISCMLVQGGGDICASLEIDSDLIEVILIPDSDNDGVCDMDDICPGGDDSIDIDGDGIPDFCDDCNFIIGSTCDDGDSCTINDVYSEDCECEGIFEDLDLDGVCDADDICPGGNDLQDIDGDGIPDFCDDCNFIIGSSCDDGDDCTVNDIRTEECECLGMFEDTDDDGICNANDICPGGDDSKDIDGDGIPDFCDDCNFIIGSTCDDGDLCTSNDIYSANCECVGVFEDADGDGVCDEFDVCDGGDDNLDTDEDGIPDFCDTDCETLSNDSFEIDSGMWIIGGNDAGRVLSTYSPTGDYSMRIRDNSFEASSFQCQIMDLSQVDLVNISFDFQAVGMEASESFLLEISQDGGNTFTILRQWSSGVEFQNNIIYNAEIEVDGQSLSTSSIFRFMCHASINSDEIYIDNLHIESCPSDCPISILDDQNLNLIESKSASQMIESNGKVVASNGVEFKAGDYILLLEGFEVEPAASFHAIIESCDPVN